MRFIVGITFYNEFDKIELAMRSVFNSTILPEKLIISCDDFIIPDRLVEKVRFHEFADRVKIIANGEKFGGPAMGRNAIISECRMNRLPLFLMDADDSIHPSHFELILTEAASNQIDIISAHRINCDTTNYDAYYYKWSNDEVSAPKKALNSQFLKYGINPVTLTGVFLSSKLIANGFMFTEKKYFVGVEDLHAWLHNRDNIFVIPKCSVLYRENSNQLSGNKVQHSLKVYNVLLSVDGLVLGTTKFLVYIIWHLVVKRL